MTFVNDENSSVITMVSSDLCHETITKISTLLKLTDLMWFKNRICSISYFSGLISKIKQTSPPPPEPPDPPDPVPLQPRFPISPPPHTPSFSVAFYTVTFPFLRLRQDKDGTLLGWKDDCKLGLTLQSPIRPRIKLLHKTSWMTSEVSGPLLNCLPLHHQTPNLSRVHSHMGTYSPSILFLDVYDTVLGLVMKQSSYSLLILLVDVYETILVVVMGLSLYSPSTLSLDVYDNSLGLAPDSFYKFMCCINYAHRSPTNRNLWFSTLKSAFEHASFFAYARTTKFSGFLKNLVNFFQWKRPIPYSFPFGKKTIPYNLLSWRVRSISASKPNIVLTEHLSWFEDATGFVFTNFGGKTPLTKSRWQVILSRDFDYVRKPRLVTHPSLLSGSQSIIFCDEQSIFLYAFGFVMYFTLSHEDGYSLFCMVTNV